MASRTRDILKPVGNGKASKDKQEDDRFKKKSEEALALVNASCKELFSDQYQKPYAVISVNAHAETLPIGSNNFKHWIASIYYSENKATLSSEDITSCLNTLKGRACFEGERRHIDIRIAKNPDDDNKAIYYDLCDPNWQCVKITRDSWTIEQAPVLFARYNNQLAQVQPSREYPPDIFDQFLELTNITSEEHRLLLKGYIISLFIPVIAKPVLITHGEQGSGKTFLERLVKMLVDPSSAESLAVPKSPSELIQQLSHNFIALYDNISKLDDWVSDMLCKAITGGGASKRMLYSDDDDVIYNFRRVVFLNGINVVARKADLLDRALMIQLERITREKRRKEADLLAEFERIKPQLLGFIFDVLVKVMQRTGEVKLTEYPRLADFAEYGEVIARCMGYPDGRFTTAYFENIKLQTIEVLEANPVGVAIVKLMEEKPEWGPGPPRELLERLNGIAEELKIDTKGRNNWPKAGNSLTRRLREVKTTLREVDIAVTIDTDSKTNTRVVSIRKIPPVSPEPPEAQNHAQTTLQTTGDMSGDTSGNTSG